MVDIYQIRGLDGSGTSCPKYTDVCNGFSSFTTTHGIPHIVLAKGLIKNLIWCIAAFSCLCGLVYNFYAITINYLSFPVYLDIQTTSTRRMDFPAVSLCNTNPIKASSLSQNNALEDLVASWGESPKKKKRRKRAAACPYNTLNGECFWRYCGNNINCFDGTNQMTYDEAKLACQSEGGTLALLDDPDKFDHMDKELDINSNTNSWNKLWIDLTYTSSKWKWSGTVKAKWTKWKDEPENPGSAVCACHANEGWTNYECTYTECYPLCEGDYGNIPTTTTTTTAVPTTTAEQTTTVEETTVPTTTTQETTTLEETTTVEETTVPTTTTEETTTLGETTTVEETTVQTTAVEDTTTTTTLDISTSMEETTSTKNPVTTIPSSTYDSTTAFGSTTYFSNFPDRPPLREDFRRELDFTEVLADIAVEEKTDMGYSMQEMILECSYNGQTCNASDFEHFYDAVHGNCYVFNSGWTSPVLSMSSTYSGNSKGLHVFVNIGQQEYLTSISEGAGVVVVIHDHDRMPFPSDEGILAVPGSKTSIGIRKIEVQRLGGRYSDCMDPDENAHNTNVFSNHYPIEYSVLACQKTCYQRNVINNCGCADAQYPMTGQALGDVTVMSCDSRNRTQDDCVYETTLKYIGDELECDCPLSCRDHLYAHTVSKILWPTEKEKDTILTKYHSKISEMLRSSNDSEFFRRNLLKVEIQFDNLNTEYLKELPKYPFVRYISDIGSIIGLWIGCSIFSILEFFEFGLDSVVFCTRYVCNKNNRRKSSNDSLPSSARTSQNKRTGPGDKCTEVKPQLNRTKRSQSHMRKRKMDMDQNLENSLTIVHPANCVAWD